jgi:hypothetical protein
MSIHICTCSTDPGWPCMVHGGGNQSPRTTAVNDPPEGWDDPRPAVLVGLSERVKAAAHWVQKAQDALDVAEAALAKALKGEILKS